VWNFKTNQMYPLRGHTDWVNQVRVDLASRTVLSASDDCQIRLWDMDTRECIKTFVGHIGHVQQVLPLPADFEPESEVNATLSTDNSDTASVASGQSSTPAVGAPAPVEDTRALYGPSFVDDPTRPLPPAFIVSGGLDATVRLWSTATGRCLKTWFGHLEGIWALQGDALRVVTGANDGMVKVRSSTSISYHCLLSDGGLTIHCIGLGPEIRTMRADLHGPSRAGDVRGAGRQPDGEWERRWRGEVVQLPRRGWPRGVRNPELRAHRMASCRPRQPF
jgi:F-box and WD-40 domain protein MET30